jgi:hypothetical protein
MPQKLDVFNDAADLGECSITITKQQRKSFDRVF